MITFQTYNNIIISKRTNNPSHTKNYSNTKKEKEKSTNNFINVKDYYLNGVNNCFNKSTLSLTSLKLKSIVPTKTQNIKTNQFTKNSTNINSIKITKTKDIIENNSQKINIINDNAKDLSANNKKTRLNRNANCINDNYLFLYGTNNNDNLSTNYISINDNKLDLNLYPKPEPMPIKICKNNYFYNNIKCNSNRNANINNIFSPEYIINKIDNENNADFNDDETINVAKANNLDQYSNKNITKYIFVNDVESADILKDNHNNVYNQLINFKDKLDKRYDYNRDMPWWHWVFLRNKHLMEKPYHCKYCNACFSHRNGKTYHERKEHTKIFPHKCLFQNCQMKFASKSALNYHLKHRHPENFIMNNIKNDN